MGQRWRDLWLEIEVRRLTSFPYLRLRVRSVSDLDRAKQNTSPHFAKISGQVPGLQRRRAA